MASESDSDLITSKRPKRKPIVLQNIDPSNEKPSSEDDIIMSNKHDNAVSNENVLVEHKKAVKRSRESEEESSITSDDEVNIKKKVRKNSDLYRPKKVVSVAARKRREAAKTLRENKIAASESDSEYDTDDNQKCENNISRRKQVNSGSENKISTDSEDYLKAEDNFSKKNAQKIQKTCDKTYQKNEDSSSAYNSDSEDGVLLQDIQTKEKKMIELNKEKNTSLSSHTLSCNEEKVKRSVNSGCELDGGDDTVVLKNKLQKETNTDDERQTKFSKDSQESNNGQLDIERKNNEVFKTSKSERDIALHFVSNSEKNSSDDETEGKMKATSNVESVEVTKNSVEQSLKGQTTLKSVSDSSSEDDQALYRSKRIAVKEENVKQGQPTDHNSDTSEDENNGFLIKVKDKNIFKTKSSKNTLKVQNSSSDSSDSDRPIKKTKVVQQLKQKKKKAVKQPSKNQYSSEDGSSDDEQPLKKTKSSTSKSHGISDSEDSDNFALKTKVRISKSKEQPSSSDDDDEPLVRKEQNSTKRNPLKSEKVEKNTANAHIPDDLNSSDDDRPLKANKSLGQTKNSIANKKKILKSAINQNSSDEENSDDEQPLKKTKPSDTKIRASSDSEDNVYQVKRKEVQNSKNRHERSRSNCDDDKPLEKKNKENNETKLKLKRKGIAQTNRQKKVSSDSEDDQDRLQKERSIAEKIDIKSEKSETRASSELSSDDSDAPLFKKTDSSVKITSEKSTAKKNSDKTSKLSAKFKADSSDSENEINKKLIRKSTEESRKQIKKEISDSEAAEEESCDSSIGKKGKRQEQPNSSKKSSEKARKQSISTSSESDSASNRTDKTKNKKEAPNKMTARINNLKKYIRAAGIHIHNYASVWEGCKSDKQRADRLSKFLEDHGMKGRPTLQKCKKLRVKLEKKREAEELDLNNIIDNDENGGRYKCRSSRKQPTEEKTVEIDKKAAERAAELKQRFSRIKDLIESDSSSG